VATPVHLRFTGATREILVVDVTWQGTTALVQPCGELDLASAGRLSEALEQITAPRFLVLDMRGLSFIDSTGLHLLMELHGRAMHEGFELQIIAPPAPADTPIRLCGLDRQLPLVADLPAECLAA
jgi:anti-sigma B factor antagonist